MIFFRWWSLFRFYCERSGSGGPSSVSSSASSAHPPPPPPPPPEPESRWVLVDPGESLRVLLPPPVPDHGRRAPPHHHLHLPADPAQRGPGLLQGGRDPLRPDPDHQAADGLQVQDRGGGEARERGGHVRKTELLNVHL